MGEFKFKFESNGMQQLYQTSSLNVFSWLYANDIKHVECVKVDGKTIFLYEINSYFRTCIQEYYTNEKLKKFIAGYREARNIVKS